MSESAVNFVIGEVQQVFGHTIGRVKAGVNECLSKSSLDVEESLTEDLEGLFSKVKDPFRGLHTTFLQESFYRNHFGCMV